MFPSLDSDFNLYSFSNFLRYEASCSGGEFAERILPVYRIFCGGSNLIVTTHRT